MLERFTSPALLVNKQADVLYFIGHTDRFLTLPVWEPSFNLNQIAREGLRYKLTAALNNAIKQHSEVVCEGLQFQEEGRYRQVDVVVVPLLEPLFPKGYALIVFREASTVQHPAQEEEGVLDNHSIDPKLLNLEQELQSTREYLQTTIEELETSNEELKSTNEELQSVNEELQSTNEELETSKEELQSTNEELTTVNTELQGKIAELSQANNDINNLLASTGIGIIFLDIDLCIKRFTPAMANIFNLLPSDMGRPIGDITANINYDGLHDDAKAVLDTLARKEIEVGSTNGKIYSMCIAPYRTVENIIDGVVLTFVNITEVKQLHRLTAVLKDSNDAITLQSRHGAIQAWNHGAELMYGYSEAEALNMNICDIVPKNKRGEALELVTQLFQGVPIESLETQRQTKDGRILDVWLTVTVIADANGNPAAIATTERDISELKRMEKTYKKTIDALRQELEELKQKDHKNE